MPSSVDARKPNRLAKEASPYLLQHARNPVDWWAWIDEALCAGEAAACPFDYGQSLCELRERTRRTDERMRARSDIVEAVVARRSVLMSDDGDQRVVMNGMSWQDYEAFLAIRGERSGVRMYFLDGAIEFMSPTKDHENRKTKLARLLEHWALEMGVDLEGFGSWTLKKEMAKAGAEPDECYTLSDHDLKQVPDFAIEVEWSRVLGLDKREIYKRLGVRELWTLKANGRLVVRVLEKGQWVEHARSTLLPELDLAWLLGFVDMPSQTTALQALRDAIRSTKRPPRRQRAK